MVIYIDEPNNANWIRGLSKQSNKETVSVLPVQSDKAKTSSLKKQDKTP
jgi:hypothetical protein